MERKKPEPGEVYTHFKGRQYKIQSIAIHTETEEELVVYEALYGSHKIYARPLDMFLSPIDRKKYPDASQIYRFELAGGLSEDSPFIIRFLDCETNEEKLRFLQQHRLELTEQFLITAAESLGYVENEKTTELRLEGLMSYLRMKIKYETSRLR